MTVQEMIKTHPQPTSLDRDALLPCIDECLDCAATCTSCADACLGENDVQELKGWDDGNGPPTCPGP